MNGFIRWISLFLWVLFWHGPIGGAEAARYNILVVMSYEKPAENPWCGEIKEGIESVVGDEGKIDYFYMDTKINFRGGEQKAKEAYAIYQKSKYDGVIAVDDNAQKMFVVPYLKNSVTTPVIFCGVNAELAAYGYPAANVTGILERGHFRESIAITKQLIPRISKVGFVVKDSPSGKALQRQIQKESDTYLAKVAAFELVKTLDEITTRENLKGCDALFVDSIRGLTNEEGASLNNREVISYLKAVFGKPIIGANNFHVESGALCAVVKTGQEQGTGAAEKLLQAMRGTPLSQISVTRNYKGKRVINVTELNRLGLKPGPLVLIGAKLVRTQ